MDENVNIDFAMPTKWTARHFWQLRDGGAHGFSLAIGPVFAIGVELISLGDTKGLAVIIGPLWLAYAQYRPTRTETGATQP